MSLSLRAFLPVGARRVLTVVLSGALLLTGVPWPVQAASAEPQRTDPPPAPQVTVNRTVPTVTRPPAHPRFSTEPTDEEIQRARLFAEPLVPVARQRINGENTALARAISETSARGTIWHTEPLTTFLAKYPSSVWAPSLLANLGVLQRYSGLVSLAFQSWDMAWQATREATDPGGKVVADFAIGQAVRFAAELGYREELDRLAVEVGTRVVRGPAGANVRYGRLVRQQLRKRPDMVIPSGPKALEHVLIALGRSPESLPASVTRPRGRARGMSMADVRTLSRGTGAPLRALQRTPTARPIVPSIVHFRFGHFSALVKQDGDRYLLRDPALGGDVWTTREALAQETTPFVLAVDRGDAHSWVDAQEVDVAAAVGRSCPPGPPCDECPCPNGGVGGGGGGSGGGGPSGGGSPGGGSPSQGSCPSCGMATYSFGAVNAALHLQDTPLAYTPPRGPAVAFTLQYSSREILQPQTFPFANLGPHWSSGWVITLSEVPAYCPPLFGECSQPYVRADLAAGWRETYGPMAADGTFPRHWHNRAQLVRVSVDPIRYERRLVDGTVEVYDLADGAPAGQRRLFRTALIDPRGQALHFTFDGQLRLAAVTDAIGQVTTLEYDAPDPLKMTRVIDPFGRAATLTYTASGQLASVTDVLGLTSRFTYEADDFVAALTTPYGVTTFRREQDAVDTAYYPSIEATDPMGETERLEFRWDSPEIAATRPANEVPAGFEAQNHDLDRYNSVYWSRRAWRQAPGDLSAAVVTRWMLAASATYASPPSVNVPHSIKHPLEARVWYAYPAQADGSDVLNGFSGPARTARRLADGGTQLSQATYNEVGHVTSRVDPLGRTTTYTYAPNAVDLLEVRQTTGGANDLLSRYGGYTGSHQPTTIADAAGQSTTLTYTSAGDVQTVTNARQETTTYTRDSAGYLQSVTAAMAGATTTYAYDGYGRLRTVTEPDGYAVTTDYDALNRPTRVAYPDGTYEETTYDRLHAAVRRDRLGRLTRFFVNARREPTGIRDPLGRFVQWTEDRLIDARGQTTTWDRDVQGRVTREVRADGVTATLYAYTADTGRLHTVTDSKQQVTTYVYGLDGAVAGLTFTNAQVSTPGVSYTYDSVYPREATMVDGTGTTVYTYHAVGTAGANRVASVDGPLPNDTITYSYDPLGRVQSRAIDGVPLTYAYDALGRVTQEVNVLGTFTYGYDGASGRLASVTYPNGQTSAYAYFPLPAEQRLETIHHRYPNGQTLSRFDYTYDLVGNIVTWRQQADTWATSWEYGYDAADQLTRAVQRSTDPTPVVLKRYGYGYDPAGNREYEQIDDAVTRWTYDTLNRLQSQSAGGILRVTGQVSEPASVTANGQPAPVDVAGGFVASVPTANGTNTLTIVATDASGNSATAAYTVDQSGPARTFGYDANGNLTSDGIRTFEWDGQNQLVAVNKGTHRSEFTYDGDNRRVQIAEQESSTVVSDARLVWDRNEITERRDAPGAVVTARVYRHGLQENGSMLNLTRDHLLSIRELTDSGSSLQARYEYAPFGGITKVAGTGSDFLGFTGVLLHKSSGLFLMKRRAYDTTVARWLSQDPLGRQGGPNLHSYVLNQPLRWIDPDGTVPMMLPWHPNGNVANWRYPQDDICSPPMGILGFNGAPCIVKCCKVHDDCYAASNCNWTSWLTIPYDSACTRCNRTVVLCIMNADIRPDQCRNDCQK